MPQPHHQCGQKESKLKKQRSALVDILVVGSLVGLTFYLFSKFDFFERLNQFLRRHEAWEVDELILSTLLVSFGLIGFCARRIFGQRREIEARQRAEDEANRLARIDPLTGLANRRVFETRLTTGLSGLGRRDRNLALMMIDLDRFKPVNDVFGHATGDEILIAFARRARGLLGSNGLLARVAGDEFAIILDPISDDDEPCRLAKQMIAMFDYPLETDGGTRITVGTSIGIAVAPRDGTEPHALIRRADLALYRVKATGRRNFRFFEEDMDIEEQKRAQIELDLRSAVTADVIHPFYQPIVDIRTREIVGFEALARWSHPEFGEISPEEFMPIAEESGQMPQLSAQLLRRACRTAGTWPDNLKLAFNVSRAQLADPTLVLRTIRILGETGFSPHRLEIEVSEAALVSDLVSAKTSLNAFRQTGVRIVLDDFGTGHSSLNHLREFKFDRIKIDRSFVAGMSNNADGLAFIRAILGLSRALGLPVTAEGVEKEEAIGQLLAEGCTEGQGFAFGKAVEAKDTLQYLEHAKLREEAS